MAAEKSTRIWLATALLLACCPAAFAGVILVDDDAPAPGDGTTWLTAYPYLQDALGAAAPTDKIWVAAGTYAPDLGAGQIAGDPNSTFQLLSGVEIYGALAGTEDPCSFDLADRDFAANETILTGEIGSPDPCDNCFTVVTGSGVDNSALLDGFTIKRGRALGAPVGVDPEPDNTGGGMYSFVGGPTVRNCCFIDNQASMGGAGMCSFQSAPIVENCDFITNEVLNGSGGAVLNYMGGAVFTNCRFYGNYADNTGGAVNNVMASVGLFNCGFFRNTGYSCGGLAEAYSTGGQVINCVFTGNTGTDGAGAIMCLLSDPLIVNCALTNNAAAGDFAGGLSVASAPPYATVPTVANCIFWDNIGGEIYVYTGSPPQVTYCDVEGGFLGASNFNADPRFYDANGPDDISGTFDDNLRLLPNSPCIDRADNTAVPADVFDIDRDGNTAEPIPLDLEANPRFMDDPDTTDAGKVGTTALPVVDVGAYEWHWPEDIVVDGIVDFPDFAALAVQWPAADCGGAAAVTPTPTETSPRQTWRNYPRSGSENTDCRCSCQASARPAELILTDRGYSYAPVSEGNFYLAFEYGIDSGKSKTGALPMYQAGGTATARTFDTLIS